MISNTSDVPMLAGGFITMDMVSKEISTKQRRTKIVCTIGPASWSEEGIATLMDAGMNIARFNFSHGDHEGHGAVLDRLRKVAMEKSRNIAGTYSTTTTTSIHLDFVRSRHHDSYAAHTALSYSQYCWIPKDPRLEPECSRQELATR
jgi:hypothetical protein